MIALGKTAVLASMILGACFNPLAAQETSRDVAFVETVTGRVVAFASGVPTLLGPLDVYGRFYRDCISGGYIADIQQIVCQNRCCSWHFIRMGLRERFRRAASPDGFRLRALKAHQSSVR
jgi:hypothetical protein